MFIGREYEIDTLNKLYSKEEFQFIVMYGRRRVGKTTLARGSLRSPQAPRRSKFFQVQVLN